MVLAVVLEADFDVVAGAGATDVGTVVVLDVVLDADVVVEPCSGVDVAVRTVVDGARRVVGAVAPGTVTAGVGTEITTTIDCGGGGTRVVTEIVEFGELDGILATASLSFCSS